MATKRTQPPRGLKALGGPPTRAFYNIVVYQESEGDWIAEQPPIAGAPGMTFRGDRPLDALAKVIEITFL